MELVQYLCFYLEESIEGCTIESLSKASDHKHNNISEVPSLHEQIYLILAIHYDFKPMLIVPEQLHLNILKT